MNTVVITIGSPEWVLYWQKHCKALAAKWAARFEKTGDEQHAVFAMYCLFKSYDWKDTTPWSK